MHRAKIRIHHRSWQLKKQLDFLLLNDNFVEDVEQIRGKYHLDELLPEVPPSFDDEVKELMEKYLIEDFDLDSFGIWLQTQEVDNRMSQKPMIAEYDNEPYDLVNPPQEEKVPTEAWLQVYDGITDSDVLDALNCLREDFGWKHKTKRRRKSTEYKRNIDIYKMHLDDRSVTEINTKHGTKFGREDINEIVREVKKEARI